MSHVSPFDWASLLADQPLIPIWTQAQPDYAERLVETLLKAGYGVLEVTLREEADWSVLKRLKALEITLVAGSVRTPQQLERLQAMGITLAITPGWSRELAQQAKRLGVRLLPGVATPGEAVQAALEGYRQVKLFPATALGGPNYLQALRAPLPELEFVPTGGINESNLASWFAVPGVVALGGSWMLPGELLKRQDWSGVEQRAARSLQTALALKAASTRVHQGA